MQLFYQPNIAHEAFLPEEEARHCTKVLRKTVGDEIDIIDGNGSFYHCKITEITKKGCFFSIIEKTADAPLPFYLHLAIAPTKNIDRTEWFVEKCTEIGVSEITFLQTTHSERKLLKLDRMEKIAVSAAKQSVKAHIPKINDLTPISSFLNKTHEGTKLIAHLVDDDRKYISKNTENRYTILIGPEGDFSADEVILAKNKGFEAISLGTSRLRTETAGISACMQVNILYF